MAKNSKLKVKSIGLDELKKAIDKFGDEVKKELNEAIRESAEEIQGKAKSNVKVVTGKTSSLIKQGIIVRRFVTRKGTLAVWDVGMDPAMNPVFQVRSKAGKVNYIPAAIEHGSARSEANPFLRPAAKSSRTSTKKRVISRLRRVIDRDY